MESREQDLARLQRILDDLRPGLTLHIDERWLKNLFGQQKARAIKAAKEFAKQSGCGFHYTYTDRFGIFNRDN